MTRAERMESAATPYVFGGDVAGFVAELECELSAWTIWTIFLALGFDKEHRDRAVRHVEGLVVLEVACKRLQIVPGCRAALALALVDAFLVEDRT